MDNTGKFIIAALAGVAAGVAIGVLIAPDKGSETRKEINDKVKKLADIILTKAEATVHKVTGTVEKA